MATSYNITVNTQEKLIAEYRFGLVEDHHSFGSGRYGVLIVLSVDISAAFPYLNAVLDDPQYDHDNSILIGGSNGRRYAFRPREIHAGMVTDKSQASSLTEEVVGLVNRVWQDRDHITPRYSKCKLPSVYEIFRLLPGTNCGECGYATCLACAADIRNGVIPLERCPLLLKPEYQSNREKILALFSPD